MNALRAINMLSTYLKHKTDFDNLGKLIYQNLSTNSNNVTQDHMLDPFAVEILANKKFYNVMKSSMHLMPKFYQDRAVEFSRYILYSSWTIITS